jgi:hypothetical protein
MESVYALPPLLRAARALRLAGLLSVKLDRPFDALERLRSAIFNHEQPEDQPMRICGYQYRARSCRRLHPRGGC